MCVRTAPAHVRGIGHVRVLAAAPGSALNGLPSRKSSGSRGMITRSVNCIPTSFLRGVERLRDGELGLVGHVFGFGEASSYQHLINCQPEGIEVLAHAADDGLIDMLWQISLAVLPSLALQDPLHLVCKDLGYLGFLLGLRELSAEAIQLAVQFTQIERGAVRQCILSVEAHPEL